MSTIVQKALIVIFPLSFAILLLFLLPLGCETTNYKRFAEFQQSNSMTSYHVKVYDDNNNILLDNDEESTVYFFVKLLKYSSTWPDNLRDEKGKGCAKSGYSTYRVLLDTHPDNIEYWIHRCEENIIDIFLIRHMGDTEYHYRYLPNEVVIPKNILDVIAR